DSSTAPLLCNAIDARPVRTKSASYLLWADHGIYGARLSSDLQSLSGSRVALLRATQPWEAGVVEGPSMLADGARFLLFFSANRFDTANYAVGYATCVSPLGPCAPHTRPILTSTDG